jgi:predicted DNA-binding transcriptional regulator AlpA
MNAVNKASPIDPLLHPKEVAELLSVSTSWLAKARLNGSGPPFIKLGRAVRYLESAVRGYIRAQTRTSTSEG